MRDNVAVKKKLAHEQQERKNCSTSRLCGGKLGAAQACRRKKTPVCGDSKNLKSSNRPKYIASGKFPEHRRRLKEQETRPVRNEILSSHMKDAREKARKTPAEKNWPAASI
ncbi:hypothetical protein PoB_002606200 [Plakobranchus ocellatus]|uniref:Uncharacterized protein n=1 Tax=Plakobranchus ocellatus TaxID=259542 RepID=A0AAV3ZWT7_9GAST|nr:hypothetical protein PoB_002606200 [Plakobranchus ocellatus]